MSYTVLERDDLRLSPQSQTALFQGFNYGEDVPVTYFWVDVAPGGGADLHRHPYTEIFNMLEGTATFRVGTETLVAQAGQIVIVPPNTPHAFKNTGEGRLRQLDIHCSPRLIQENLE